MAKGTREGYSVVGEGSRDTVRSLVRAVGPQQAAAILHTRTRQVERWAAGSGWVRGADRARIAHTELNMDVVRGMTAHNRRRPVEDRLEDRKAARAIRTVLDLGGRKRLGRRMTDAEASKLPPRVRKERKALGRAFGSMGYGPRSKRPYVKRQGGRGMIGIRKGGR